MYNPPSFVENRTDILHAFMREQPFAALVSCGPNGFVATHAPMLLDTDAKPGGVLRCHVARANPQWRELQSSPAALVIFSGLHHYISPSWYPSTEEHGRVVPTWNYVAVHVWGQAKIFEDANLLVPYLRELTSAHEATMEKPWNLDDAPAQFIETMAKAIVGIEIPIERIAGKWKLGQNRTSEDRAGAIQGLEKLDTPQSREMAAAMREALGSSR
jgi:transcriptional regulator